MVIIVKKSVEDCVQPVRLIKQWCNDDGGLGKIKRWPSPHGSNRGQLEFCCSSALCIGLSFSCEMLQIISVSSLQALDGC